jgi:hypothetical protein
MAVGAKGSKTRAVLNNTRIALPMSDSEIDARLFAMIFPQNVSYKIEILSPKTLILNLIKNFFSSEFLR